MARLIDADALEDDVMERYCKDCEKRKGMKRGKWRVIYEIGEAPCRACDVDDMKTELEEAPTIDAEPTRHGKWIKVGDNTYRCSRCNEVSCCNGNFCTDCGARMDASKYEELEINPCRGCEDYDGKGGCLSNGGCANVNEVKDEL